MTNKNTYPMIRIRSPLAAQLTDDPAQLGSAVNEFLAQHLAKQQQAPTRRFNCQTYELLEAGLDICPGRSGCLKRWGDRYGSFRTAIGIDGRWAVYGLPKDAA